MHKGSHCQLCGREYRVDLEIPDRFWERIRRRLFPKPNLLCGSCIMKLLEDSLPAYDAWFVIREL